MTREITHVPDDCCLGYAANARASRKDQLRQRREAEEILARLQTRPGVVLADEVGMGKTFVALAVAYAVAQRPGTEPVVVMVPSNLVDKWSKDLGAFCDLYVDGKPAVDCRKTDCSVCPGCSRVLRFGVARHSIDFLKLLDDPADTRCHLILLTSGSMSRGLTDAWVRLALIQRTLKKHGRRQRLSKVRRNIHLFLGDLLRAGFRQKASQEGDRTWARLLEEPAESWREVYNASVSDPEKHLADDPVPAAVLAALPSIDLGPLADALATVPVRRSKHLGDRLQTARDGLREAAKLLWGALLTEAEFHSPLLILDEAHHLKNPDTMLARTFQTVDEAQDVRIGDGAFAGAFERMLFLTATPFQLGHRELVRVLRRFGDARWAPELGEHSEFTARLDQLAEALDAAQGEAIRFQRAWGGLPVDALPDGVTPDDWWKELAHAPEPDCAVAVRRVLECAQKAKHSRKRAERLLRKWVIRHSKGKYWFRTRIQRRERFSGGEVIGVDANGGIPIPDDRLLPFFLAARCADLAREDLLGDALCSSYEAFRDTRRRNRAERDEWGTGASPLPAIGSWYLGAFDAALKAVPPGDHPKMQATVRWVVDRWEAGEKVLVFAFYVETCRALRLHISDELERRTLTHARRRLAQVNKATGDLSVDTLLKTIQSRFIDHEQSLGRRALDGALDGIIGPFHSRLLDADVDQEELKAVMRRFLRVRTTLVRAFPITNYETMRPHVAVRSMLDSEDGSHVSWRAKFTRFVMFLLEECAPDERAAYLDAARRTQTGSIRVRDRGDDEIPMDRDDDPESALTLANVQLAIGATKTDRRARLMRAFNTPFFPDILVASSVMAEGVDLHRYCRHVIHHDLAWNPSAIEQRTGRVDRIGCKAEGKNEIEVALPYLAGTADERQFRVMSERENWFNVVMGQEDLERLIPEDDDEDRIPLPSSLRKELSFSLGL
jgi:hypothetical protein